MAKGAKVKGPGGLGQWDTGTANQDIRASYRGNTGNTGGGGATGGGMVSQSQGLADALAQEKRTNPKKWAMQEARLHPRTGRGNARKGGRRTR
jgi:hypothetical protein